jgi:hypothetical protein
MIAMPDKIKSMAVAKAIAALDPILKYKNGKSKK